MKYQHWKIKKEHHILKEFDKFLTDLEKFIIVKRIIPWRISRQQKWTSQKIVSFSYFTNSWIKLNLKKWSTVQELFVICDEKDKTQLFEMLNKLFESII